MTGAELDVIGSSFAADAEAEVVVIGGSLSGGDPVGAVHDATGAVIGSSFAVDAEAEVLVIGGALLAGDPVGAVQDVIGAVFGGPEDDADVVAAAGALAKALIGNLFRILCNEPVDILFPEI